MKNEFKKYIDLKATGLSAIDAAKQAKHAGLDAITRIRLVRKVYGMSFAQAKEVLLIADGVANSLSEHEGKFLSILEEALSHRIKEPTP